MQQEIVALALKYGLMSRETSFVAIERRETPVQGDVKLRRIPIAVTTGWGGLDRPAGRTLGGVMSLGAPAAMMDTGAFELADFEASALEDDMPESAALPMARQSRQWVFSRDVEIPAWSRSRADVVPWQSMHALVALQRADGSWELDPRAR